MLRRAALSSVRSVSRRTAVQGLKALTSTAPHAPELSGARLLSRQRPVQAAHFSSDASALSVQMPERKFVELADETLHDIQSWLDGIEEMLDESDVMFSQGVLKIDLGEHGTWVLNRQVPNRQIWWSSPISGPRRYEYDAENGIEIYS
ncbi:unnamed protein product [Hyaloperonospora brassicae]|uniref:Ferroxidase n=1 Tax=Hyaloperonospora brassicae TaxID=162125 RepID=A0AAV0UN27_HYABA|nr:unnamed protein product [Hyaloperonospora brassicae]